MENNSFGRLVKSAREQRGWSQAEVAERWGHTREYVSQVERGIRKLDRWEEVERLTEVLEIPIDRLDAIGKSLPRRKVEAETPAQADDILFQALLESSAATVKFSWLVWYSENNELIVKHLDSWIGKLNDATTKYRGQFLQPALAVLAYSHEMRGKIFFDRLQYQDAQKEFSAMFDIGEEIRDHDAMALAMIYQADILRKRGFYETAVRRLEAAKNHANQAENICVKGLRWNILARAHAAYGQEKPFLVAIDEAQRLVEEAPEDLDALCQQFTRVEVLQERAQGYSMLWRPEEALKIYQQTDKMKPIRPLRELGSYNIVKAQAHAYNGNLEDGVTLAMRGLKLAARYHSIRHISRVQGMYDRLSVTKMKKEPRLRELKDALHKAQRTVQA